MTRQRVVLCAVDLGDLSDVCVAHARFIAERAGAKLILLHVQSDVLAPTIEVDMVTPLELAEIASRQAEAGLLDIAEPLQAAGVDVEVKHVLGEPVAHILSEADDYAADLIVVATHSRKGVQRVLLGSVAGALARQATRPVYLVREGSEPVGFSVPRWLG